MGAFLTFIAGEVLESRERKAVAQFTMVRIHRGLHLQIKQERESLSALSPRLYLALSNLTLHLGRKRIRRHVETAFPRGNYTKSGKKTLCLFPLVSKYR